MVEKKTSLYTAIKSSYYNKETYKITYPDNDIIIDTIQTKRNDDIMEINITINNKNIHKNNHGGQILKSLIDIAGPNQEFKLLFHCFDRVTNFTKKEKSEFLRNHVVFDVTNPKPTSNIRIYTERIDIT